MMEMEHINENLIKVMIGVEDLEARGIDFLDIIGDQSSIEKFFYSILEEVDVDQHFHDSEAVTFQVIPSSEGLELYISRANLDEMEEIWEDELSKRLKERKDARKTDRHDVEENNDHPDNSVLNIFNPQFAPEDDLVDEDQLVSEESIVFNTLDDFLRLARLIPFEKVQADLYHFNDHYHLILYNLESAVKTEQETDKLLGLFEYGESSPATSSLLAEHGKMIRASDALSFFGSNF